MRWPGEGILRFRSGLVVAAVGSAGRCVAAFRRFHSHLDSIGGHLLPFPRGRTFYRVGVSRRLLQPPIRIKAMEFSVRRSPAPGAVRRPRKPSSSAGCVHAIENLQVTGYPDWGQHLVAHSRLAGRTRGERTGAGRLRSVVFPSTQCGSRPGQQHYANDLSGSKSTWSFIT